MVFISICTAVYDYVPQGQGELPIREGELVYILEKSDDDDWWKAKKRATGEEEDEPVGLIPNNYVEEAQPTHHAKALYDYTRQTDEELSFSEDAVLQVYDSSDPDWTLVGLNGEFGFAPANYIEITSETDSKSPPSVLSPRPQERDVDDEQPSTPRSASSPSQSPAAALAGIIHKQADSASPPPQRSSPENTKLPPRRPQYTPQVSDEEASTPPAPSLPQRPPSQTIYTPSTQYVSPRSPEPRGVIASPPGNRATYSTFDEDRGQPSPGGFHLYNINEMVSAMGKKKKLPTTLGINLATGNIMIAPEKSRDGPQQEWTAEKLTHYSIEGKHVFMELVRPSKSIDFHAGAKDTAQEIVAALGELAGAVRAEGLREVIAASSGSGGQRKGEVLYDFMAQGDDEVTVAVGDEVIILDDTKSEEWWMVRRLKNREEGVVPSSYVEITGVSSAIPTTLTGVNAGRSPVEQNRLEEERLAMEASKAAKKRGDNDVRGSEVGPGVKLPQRGSSLMGGHDNNTGSSQRNKRENQSDGRSLSSSKPKPDASKTRTWTDRSGSFKVDAEFIGLKDGKIHLHKLNGVKIAVPVTKMAVEDLEYVERVTGVSLDDEKPLSEIRRNNKRAANGTDRNKAQPSSSTVSKAGASVQPKKEPEYDWFDFFLKCGVSPYQCERYAFNFNRDSMDEGVLPDITPAVLRTLGLKEGDILRVMKFLDTKYGRTSAKSKLRNVSFGGEEMIGNDDEGESSVASPNGSGGGLFSGPGGTLRNNTTRKGRPAPAIQTNDTIDPKAFQQKGDDKPVKIDRLDSTPTPVAAIPTPNSKATGGFDDDAWDVKPSKQQPTASQVPSTSSISTVSAPSQPILTGAMAELSLLSPPLQPSIVQSTGPQQASQSQQRPQNPQQTPLQQSPAPVPQPQQQPQQLQQQPTGANPSFFSQLGQQTTGAHLQQMGVPQAPPLPTYNSHLPGPSQPNFQLGMPPRQRPQAPQAMQQGSLMPPPPPRPLSAPQNVSPQNNFGPPPLQPQLTGVPHQGSNQSQIVSQGPSLNDLTQMRLQQQYGQQLMQPQFTSFGQQGPSVNLYGNGIAPQLTGQQFQLSQQPTGFRASPLFLNGQQTGSPFADSMSTPLTGGFQPMSTQPINFSPLFQSPLQTQQTGSINSFLPPALQPTLTGMTGPNNRPGFGQPQPPPPMPSVPPIPQQQTLAPLQPQKTGPPPPVRFGVVGEAKKLMPQATGRKANLSQATPQNPFGF